MAKRRKAVSKPQKLLDTISEKRGRGRPKRVSPSETEGRAYNYRIIFDQIWDAIGEPLLKAQTKQDVIEVFGKDGRYLHEFEPIAGLVLSAIHDPEFPKTRQTQINFLADSLPGRGRVSLRRSRDICAEVRAQQKKAHHIIRHEFYVECSCGYKGPALNNACRKCKTKIGFVWEPGLEM